jgi:hypothetical protein
VAKHIRRKEVRFDIAFRPSDQASAHAGQLAVLALLNEFGLWRRVRQAVALDWRLQKGKGFDPEVLVAQLVWCFTSGGVSLADAGRLNQDMALKALIGVEAFADETTLGEWLREVGPAGWQAVRQINREFVVWTLARAEPGRYLHAGRLEGFFDDTQIEVSGKKFEGAKINYEGNLALSWQTLWAGPLLADGILGATSETKESPRSEEAGKDVSNGLPEMLEANAGLWEGRRGYLYADSASSAGKYLELIEGSFEAWSVSYNKWTGPLEKKAAEWPEWAWSAEEKTQWNDGTEHVAQYASFTYQPGGCERPKHFAVVRHKAVSGELFWRYAFVVGAAGSDPRLRFEHHRLKGDKERAFSELLRDLDLHHPPCADLDANRLFYGLAGLAYNVLQALKLIHLPESEQPKRVGTLIRHLLMLPVEIKRHARRLKACLFVPAGWVKWWRGFLGQLLPQCRQLGQVVEGVG